MYSENQCRCQDCQKHPYSALARRHRFLRKWVRSMDERCRRQFAGFLAQEDGYGGVSLISKVTGLNRMTILKGIEELKHLPMEPSERIRKSGGGRKRIEKKDQRSFLS